MKQPIDQVIGIIVPPDGYTPEEQELSRLLGDHTVAHLYAKLPTSRMKAIVAMHFELGYDQELVAHVFGVSQAQISQEIKAIREVFLNRRHTGDIRGTRPHVSRSKKTAAGKITVKDLLEVCYLLSRA